MCSDVAVRVQGVSKVYHVYEAPHERLLQALFKNKTYYKQSWALRRVDFEVQKGETVGIIGRNGSGKSTLLQIICGTLAPSDGVVEVNGRVSALLELGAGFDPEFSGHDNVYLYASILGLTRREVDMRYDAITAFADIGAHINQPVKTYSSGMLVRLAFAVAINVDPDILIIDEALAVGDEAFQRKCYARLKSIRDNGATILFVSHGADVVVQLCDRAILLDQGERLLMGAPKVTVAAYQKLIYAPAARAADLRAYFKRLDAEKQVPEDVSPLPPTLVLRDEQHQLQDDFDPNLRPQSTVNYEKRGAEILSVGLFNSEGRQVNRLRRGGEYTYRVRVRFERAAFTVRFGILIKTLAGFELGGLVSHSQGEGVEYVEAGTELEVAFGVRASLAPGVYFGNAGVLAFVDGEEIFLHRLVDACMFRVQPEPHLLITATVDFGSNVICSINSDPVSASEGELTGLES